MYRVPVINFIDKVDKCTEVAIFDENTHRKLDVVRGGDNREYKLENLKEWYVARITSLRPDLITIAAYQYPKN